MIRVTSRKLSNRSSASLRGNIAPALSPANSAQSDLDLTRQGRRQNDNFLHRWSEIDLALENAHEIVAPFIISAGSYCSFSVYSAALSGFRTREPCRHPARAGGAVPP